MYGEILDIFGGGGVITKLDYFWVSFIYIFFLRSRYRIGIFLGDWYISNIFGVATDIPVLFFFCCCFFLGGGGVGGGGCKQ